MIPWALAEHINMLVDFEVLLIRVVISWFLAEHRNMLVDEKCN